MKYLLNILVFCAFFNGVYADDTAKENDSKKAPKIEVKAEALTYKGALEKATKEKKSVFILFTGKDWCGPCQELEKTVLNTEEFKKYVEKKIVFLELDYPQGGTSEENEKLSMDYGIEGFPTILIVDEAGKPFQRLMFQGQNTQEFIIVIDSCLRQKELKNKFVAAKTPEEKEVHAKEFMKSRLEGESISYFIDLITLATLKDKDLKVEDKIAQLGDLYINSMDREYQKTIAEELKKLDPEKKLGTERLFTIRAFIDLIIDNQEDKAYDFFVANKTKFKGEDLGYLYQFGMQLKVSGKPEKTIEIINYILTDDMIKNNEEAVKGLNDQIKELKGANKAKKDEKKPDGEAATKAVGSEKPAEKVEPKAEEKKPEEKAK